MTDERIMNFNDQYLKLFNVLVRDKVNELGKKGTTIYKYLLKGIDYQVIDIPLVEILTVKIQNGKPYLWAVVKPKEDPAKVMIRIVGTGHPFMDYHEYEYINTFKMYGDNFIGHVFWKKLDEKEKEEIEEIDKKIKNRMEIEKRF